MARRKSLVISGEQMRVIDGILAKLRRVTGSRFVALVSTSGQPITTDPPEGDTDTLSLGALAAGSFAATRQLAEVLKEREFSLLFHEGKESNLHVVQVSEQILLLITFGRDTQVGRVRLFTGRAVEVLKPIFEHAEEINNEDVMVVDQDYSSEVGSALEDWFPADAG